MDKTVNVRKFTVAPDMIYSLIKAQAGTLAKSVGECVMNSIDAGATAIHITATQQKLVISDNGRGLQTRAEIEQCFEVFGFDHKAADREFGQFGIGRAQLWNFCATVWTTNTFRMDVDIKNKGLDYDLLDGLPQQAGLVIEGRFYETVSAGDLLTFERELKELVKYVPIAVILNGKRISREAAKEKWSHDLPQAWIKIRETGDLYVYNLGFFVRRFPAYQFGCGGVVVTKPGVRLALNMARNDILVSVCEIWQQLKPFLQQAAAGTGPRERLTDAGRNNMIHRFLAGELAEPAARNARLVQDILGKYHTLHEIAPALLWGHRPISVAEPGNSLGEYVHRSRRAFIVSPATLTRFGADTVAEFARQLKQGLTAIYPWYQAATPVACENFRDICRELSELRMPVPPAEWTAAEQAAIITLNQLAGKLPGMLAAAGHVTAPRKIELGASDTDRAWTDGQSYITLDRKTIALAQKGIGGWQIILNVLIREYLCTEAAESVRDPDFYRRYFDATVYGLESHLDLLEAAFKLYINVCRKKGLVLQRKLVNGFDLLDGVLTDG